MANCHRWQDDLKAYCDQELPWPRRLRVRRHLAECAACRQEVNSMTQIAEDLRASEEPQTPLTPSLRARLLAAPPPTATAPRKHALQSPVSGWQLAAAGVIVFVMAAVLFPVFSQSREKARNIVFTAQAPAAPTAAAMQRNLLPQHGVMSANLFPLTVRQVHKDASLGVQVNDPEAGSDQVTQMVKDAGGYVSNSTLTTNPDGSQSANLSLAVPVAQFDTILSQIGKLGVVQSKNVTGQDITGQVSDAQQAESVLETQVRQSQARLAELGKKASWNDAETGRELTIQLAQARARLVLLRKLGQLSSISLTLTQTPKPAPPIQSGFLSNLHNTTHGATQSLFSSLGMVLTLLIWTLAYAPLWLPLMLLGRWLYRRTQITDSPSIPTR